MEDLLNTPTKKLNLNNLVSLNLERHVLSALLKQPQIFPEIDTFLTDADFYNKVHQTVFCVIRNSYLKNEKLDKVLLAQKIKNLNINFFEEVDIFDYIENLFFSNINEKAGIESCKELIKLRIRREICETADRVKEFVVKNGDKKIDDLIACADQIYNEKVDSYTSEHEPLDLYEGIIELIEERGNNPVEEIGLITPYPEFNAMFGGLRSGNGVYSVISRPKIGKSSYLLQMAEGVVLLNEGCKCLILDTEMKTEVNRFRAAAAITEVPMWFLETGNYRKNVELYERVKANLHKVKKCAGKVYHLRVANRPIEEICAIIRRWYYKYVGRGNKGLVVYDYLKLTGEKLTSHWSEYQAIGDKINKINEIGGDLDIPIWVAMQQNRTAEDGKDDSSTAAQSDRLQWFCAFNAIFRRKTFNEISDYGSEFGTHLLKPLAERFQGRNSKGHLDLVNIGDKKHPKYVQNFINYNVENFKITELGTLRDIIEKRKDKVDIDDPHQNSDDIL